MAVGTGVRAGALLVAAWFVLPEWNKPFTLPHQEGDGGWLVVAGLLVIGSLPLFLGLPVVLIALNPPAVLLAMAVTYALSGPVWWLCGKVTRRPRPPQDSASGQPGEKAQVSAPAPEAPPDVR